MSLFAVEPNWVEHNFDEVKEAKVVAGTKSAGNKNGKKSKFAEVFGLCWNPSDNSLLICDSGNSKLRKLTTKGKVSRVYKSEALCRPHAVAQNKKTNDIYICNSAHTIIKLTSSGLSVVAGSGKVGRNDGRGKVASFTGPSGIAIDQQTGVLYISEHRNNLIRKITPKGEVSTLAGSEAGYHDGIGNEAKFNSPWGMCFDEIDQYLFVCDSSNNKIRRISLDGTVSTFAEVPSPTYIVASKTALLVTSERQNRIYKITREGNVSILSLGENELNLPGPRGITLCENSNSCFVVTDSGLTITKIDFA